MGSLRYETREQGVNSSKLRRRSNVGLFASFTGLPCPECGLPIMVSGIYHDMDEPQLGVTTCGHCQAELQVSKDPMTGEARAEKKKPN